MDDHEVMLLFAKYPLMLRLGTGYSGYVKVKDKDYKVDVAVRDNKFDVKITKDLERFQHQILDILQPRRAANIIDYLDRLFKILDDNTDAESTRIRNDADRYRDVINEYAEFRQFFISVHQSTISSDLSEIHIVQKDECGRKHELMVGVDYDRTAKLFRITGCDLPESGRLLNEADDSLVSLYERFLATLDTVKLQKVFDVMDEIDRCCWVLDPEKPSRKDLYRRIMIDDKVSAVIEFNSADVRDLPHLKFLGPQTAVRKYTEALNRNFIDWDPNEDILQEILKLLGISHFPAKPSSMETEELLYGEGECCICFCLRLDDKLPEIVCPNPSCNQYFHKECLYQYLCTLNSRRFYYEIYGTCPNCDKAIHCPLLST